MRHWLRERLGERPGWMNPLLFFCVFMALVYVPWDLFVKPIGLDEEVWFGVRFEGIWAKLLALPHWAVYAAGSIGFWKMRRWMWPWGAVYTAQGAIGMFVWPLLYVGGFRSWIPAVASGALFAGLALALWRSRERFEHARPPLRGRYGGWARRRGGSGGGARRRLPPAEPPPGGGVARPRRGARVAPRREDAHRHRRPGLGHRSGA